MKRIIGIIAISACLMTACSKEAAYFGPSPGGDMVADNGTSPVYLEYNAIVTVKQEAGGRIYFQLDDNNILYPDRKNVV